MLIHPMQSPTCELFVCCKADSPLKVKVRHPVVLRDLDLHGGVAVDLQMQKPQVRIRA